MIFTKLSLVHTTAAIFLCYSLDVSRGGIKLKVLIDVASKHRNTCEEEPTMFGKSSAHLATVEIALVKWVHTLIFLYMGACVLNILYSGLTNRISRLTKVSLAMVTCEGLIFFGNGRRCPLTNLAESLGSGNGTVGDIFLPTWFAQRIPVISSTLVLIGVAAMGVHRLIDPLSQRRVVRSGS